jgi:hypothetical protein
MRVVLWNFAATESAFAPFKVALEANPAEVYRFVNVPPHFVDEIARFATSRCLTRYKKTMIYYALTVVCSVSNFDDIGVKGLKFEHDCSPRHQDRPQMQMSFYERIKGAADHPDDFKSDIESRLAGYTRINGVVSPGRLGLLVGPVDKYFRGVAMNALQHVALAEAATRGFAYYGDIRTVCRPMFSVHQQPHGLTDGIYIEF